MTIQYLSDNARAASGLDRRITAIITDDNGDKITDNCNIKLWAGDTLIYTGSGEYNGVYWCFVIPAEITIDLHGRYFYDISCGDEYIGIRQPITII